MQKYLRCKSLYVLTIVVFFMSSTGMVLLSLYDKQLTYINIADINEENVDFIYVFSQNIILITKIYLIGLLTVNLFSIFSWLHNVISVGLIANSLVMADYGMLAAKMIPHGIFEFIGISLAVSTVMWMWAKAIKNVPKVIKQEKDVIELGKEILVVGVSSYVMNIGIFFVAGIVEVIVSLHKVTG